MKYIYLFILLFLFSCSDDCKVCETVTYNDERKQLGLANDGFEERNRVLIGQLCGEDITNAKEMYEGDATISTGNITYTERVRIECN